MDAMTIAALSASIMLGLCAASLVGLKAWSGWLDLKRLELTQAALAELVGVSRKTINTVENGIFVPSTVLALRLAKALGTTVEALFQLR